MNIPKFGILIFGLAICRAFAFWGFLGGNMQRFYSAAIRPAFYLFHFLLMKLLFCRKKTALFPSLLASFLLLCSAVLSSPASATEYSIYGPEPFVRTSLLVPLNESRQIPAAPGGGYLLRVQNGFCDGESNILNQLLSLLGLSGDCVGPVGLLSQVTLNGEVAVSGLELLLSGAVIEKSVTLAADNTLRVEIGDLVNHGLVVEILGYDNAAPQIEANATPSPTLTVGITAM
ncbi:hypothetical protein [Microbulbifer taiwanensis]|uniref:hypothetical protein n=1 Tax=Microbulbifer taiwanensis TaxID=986746 RepID=UPI0036202E57